MHKFDEGWRPAKNRPDIDPLLREYCRKQGGITFAEAEVPDDPYRGYEKLRGYVSHLAWPS
jgi:hypothetical protein